MRAIRTAELAAEAGDWQRTVEPVDALYDCPATAVLAAIRGLNDESESVLVAGHEPTCSEATGLFVGNAEVNFVTAAVARIDFAVGRWQDVAFGGGVLAWLVTPKLLSAR